MPKVWDYSEADGEQNWDEHILRQENVTLVTLLLR